MTKILVTGGSGFIGTHLVPRLHASRYEVFTANSRSGDIADYVTWTAFSDAEIVIHLAGRTFVPDSWDDPGGFLHTNLHGTICALNYCKERNARLIFVSTYLYGIPKALPISENAELETNNPYALSKKMAEDACRFYSDYYGLQVTILRPFNVYGPGQDPKFLIPAIIDQVARGIAVKVKDLEPKRDYVYIDDLIEAFLCAVEKPRRFDIFNIASGRSYSVGEVIDLIQDIARTNFSVHSEGERRKQEVMDTRADIAHAREILGWEPSWTLSAGCTRLLQEKMIAR